MSKRMTCSRSGILTQTVVCFFSLETLCVATARASSVFEILEKLGCVLHVCYPVFKFTVSIGRLA
jgi:hypothetical protein